MGEQDDFGERRCRLEEWGMIEFTETCVENHKEETNE
jgi:hypothetical protein